MIERSVSSLFVPRILQSTEFAKDNEKIFKYFPADKEGDAYDNLSMVTADFRIDGHSFISDNRRSRAVSCPKNTWGARQVIDQADFTKLKKPLKKFITGSRYEGEWNNLGFAGKGTYRYPHGVIYEGWFNRKGEFHGNGTLTYPSGQKIRGMWKSGRLLEDFTFVFSCNEVLNDQYRYCQMPDRRFYIEIQNELNPAGFEYLTNAPYPRHLPPGTYDVADGVYYPYNEQIMIPMAESKKKPRVGSEKYGEDRSVSFSGSMETEDQNQFEKQDLHTNSFEIAGEYCQEIPSWIKRDWILKHCRNADDRPVGYQPNLYKTWMAGRKEELFHFHEEDNRNIKDFLILEKAMDKKVENPLFSFIRKPSLDKWKLNVLSSTRRTEPNIRTSGKNIRNLLIDS